MIDRMAVPSTDARRGSCGAPRGGESVDFGLRISDWGLNLQSWQLSREVVAGGDALVGVGCLLQDYEAQRSQPACGFRAGYTRPAFRVFGD